MSENGAVAFTRRNENEVGGIVVYALSPLAMKFYAVFGANARDGGVRHGRR